MSKGHYNPKNVNYPMHAGDFLLLFSNNCYSYMMVCVYE